MKNRQRLCGLFAEIIDYPGDETAALAAELSGRLEAEHPEAARELEPFRRFCEATPVERLEELYTQTFDLQPQCSPYLGYHLCGEGYQRSRFLVGLQEVYRAHGFAAEGELADHYREVLRFLSHVSDEETWCDLAADGLLPAIAKGLEGLPSENPYASLLGVLRIFLERTVGADETRPLKEEIAQ